MASWLDSFSAEELAWARSSLGREVVTEEEVVESTTARGLAQLESEEKDDQRRIKKLVSEEPAGVVPGSTLSDQDRRAFISFAKGEPLKDMLLAFNSPKLSVNRYLNKKELQERMGLTDDGLIEFTLKGLQDNGYDVIVSENVSPSTLEERRQCIMKHIFQEQSPTGADSKLPKLRDLDDITADPASAPSTSKRRANSENAGAKLRRLDEEVKKQRTYTEALGARVGAVEKDVGTLKERLGGLESALAKDLLATLQPGQKLKAVKKHALNLIRTRDEFSGLRRSAKLSAFMAAQKAMGLAASAAGDAPDEGAEPGEVPPQSQRPCRNTLVQVQESE